MEEAKVVEEIRQVGPEAWSGFCPTCGEPVNLSRICKDKRCVKCNSDLLWIAK